MDNSPTDSAHALVIILPPPATTTVLQVLPVEFCCWPVGCCSPMPSHHECFHCHVIRPTPQGVKAHIQLSGRCRRAWQKRFQPPAESLSSSPAVLDPDITEDPPPINVPHEPEPPVEPASPSKRARVEAVEDPEYDAGGLPLDPFTDVTITPDAGEAKGRGKTLFEAIHDERKDAKEEVPWAPFASEEEWGIARWLMTCGLSQSEIDKYLKLEIVR